MRLLITGGAGTLGAVFAARYERRAESVCVVDNFATGHRAALEGMRDIAMIEGSVADAELMKELFDEHRPTHVIHCAAAYKDPAAVVEQADTNVRGMAVLIEQATQSTDLRTIVNLQTVLCYGRPDATPIPVDAPLRPRNNYAVTKVAAEELLFCSGLPFTSLRIANTLTPGLAIGPIPTFYQRIKNGEACTISEASRDFIDIDDVCTLMDRVLDHPDTSGVFNVSTGEGHSIAEIFRFVCEHLGLEVEATVQPVSGDDVAVVVVDPSETRRVWNWEARVEFRESLFRVLSDYDRSGVGAIYSHFRDDNR